ncbi:MAG: hypothetical protein KJ072_28735 [Verrucomicrobia bacterium]|nr:hypothetical protein [Verrucomicrobiota bacterium]
MSKPPFWRTYQNQKDLVDAIRSIVNPQPFDTEFSAPLISDFILERHYFCRHRSLRPTAFKKTREDSPYRFYGEFQSFGWHPVSWRKCVQLPPSARDILCRALRDRTLVSKSNYRRRHPICEACGQSPAVEVHHAEPTFNALVESVLAVTTLAEQESALATWDWFRTEAFSIPDTHVLAVRFDQLHARARLQALCRCCHNLTKSSTTEAKRSGES